MVGMALAFLVVSVCCRAQDAVGAMYLHADEMRSCLCRVYRLCEVPVVAVNFVTLQQASWGKDEYSMWGFI